MLLVWQNIYLSCFPQSRLGKSLTDRTCLTLMTTRVFVFNELIPPVLVNAFLNQDLSYQLVFLSYENVLYQNSLYNLCSCELPMTFALRLTDSTLFLFYHFYGYLSIILFLFRTLLIRQDIRQKHLFKRMKLCSVCPLKFWFYFSFFMFLTLTLLSVVK